MFSQFPWGNELSDRDRGGDRGDRGGERGGDRERGGRDRDRERGLVCKLDRSHTKGGGVFGSAFSFGNSAIHFKSSTGCSERFPYYEVDRVEGNKEGIPLRIG